MEKRKRIFISIDFPQETKEEIGQLTTLLKKEFPQVAWTKVENIHLTIKFLGYVRENLLGAIKEAVEDSLERIRPFELVFENLGYFDREQLIVWLGAKSNSSLLTLIKNLDKEMLKLGFKKERREFTPHITIGRGKRLDRDILKKIKHRIVSSEFILPKTFTVSEIMLMESKLSPKGPIYEEVRSFSLRASG